MRLVEEVQFCLGTASPGGEAWIWWRTIPASPRSCFPAYFCGQRSFLLAVPSSFAVNRAAAAYRLPGEHIRHGAHLTDGIPCVPLALFKDEPFVFLKPENDTRQRQMALCLQGGFTPRVVLELDQQVTAYNLTDSGMGISFISDTLVRSVPPHPNVTYYKLSGPLSQRRIWIYQKRGRYVSRAMEAFLDIARAGRDGSGAFPLKEGAARAQIWNGYIYLRIYA